jgi:hypothetical protein
MSDTLATNEEPTLRHLQLAAYIVIDPAIPRAIEADKLGIHDTFSPILSLAM